MQRQPDGKQEKETLYKGLSKTMCRRTLREDGVSEAVGTMLLITIIALGVSIFVAGVVLQPVDSEPPAFTFNVSYGSEGEVYIRHLGGEAVSRDLLHVYVDDGENTENVTEHLTIDGTSGWNTWHIGETLVYTPSPSLAKPPEVAMTYADQSGAQYLYYASYNWTGAIPTVTPGVPPTADFTANPTSGPTPLTVHFTDTSTGGAREWSWNFGDGGTATQQHPTHTYTIPGTYTVSLTAGNAYGSNIETKADYITVNVPSAPVADFIGTPLSGAAPLTVQFTDTSTNAPTSWAWNFGDGGTSTLQNPSHTYAATGTYTVTLTATNAGGSDAETKVGYITVAEPTQPPTAAFSANVTNGTAPLAVLFTDESTGSPTSWSWTFGDGNTSTEQNPKHTYASAGIYTVSLTATNAGGSHTETKTNYVTVTAPPPTVAAITPSTGESGTTVTITNLAGTNFQNGATVKLTKSGETDIHATDVIFTGNTQIACSLNLAGAATGLWNVIVTNPDTQSGTLQNGFNVTIAQIYEPEPDLNDELTHWTTTGTVEVTPEGDAIELTGTNDDEISSIERTLSTVGYQNITVSFSLAAVGLQNPSDAVAVKWFDGTSWYELLRIGKNDDLADDQFHDFSYSLPPSADDNPLFAIQFRVEHQGKTESALLDLNNLEITGDPI